MNVSAEAFARINEKIRVGHIALDMSEHLVKTSKDRVNETRYKQIVERHHWWVNHCSALVKEREEMRDYVAMLRNQQLQTV